MSPSENNCKNSYRFPVMIVGVSLLMTLAYAAQALTSEIDSVSGTLLCPEDFVLPSNAIAYITLTDVSSLQESSSELIARQIIHQPCQASTSFELTYNPTKINERHLYAIQVRIAFEDEIILTNASAYPVITQGNPTITEIHVAPVD